MLIKEITLGFENCDQVTIDGKWIGDFLVEDIKTSISRQAINWIGEQTVAHTVVIEIAFGANKDYQEFGQKGESFKSNVFERLKQYNDITSIEFTLYDQYKEDIEEKEYYYLTTWVGENDCENEAQEVYQSNCGNLYIVISDKKSFEDFFDKEEINNPDDVNFRFDMWDIGRDSNDSK